MHNNKRHIESIVVGSVYNYINKGENITKNEQTKNGQIVNFSHGSNRKYVPLQLDFR